ncbi:Las1-like family protein [Babesia ovis]|uniref:Las1-like family protein n=1 Tax=Babesia ovis TaxID=5869 RepID=A0A9W5TCR9_BABOV|nr:Las1-like family protein [Babesia ovis]
MTLEPTGWYSYDELAQVFARLRDPEEYPFIARKISLWKSRAKVPAAINATESLLNAIITDDQHSVSDSALCSLYAMAVIRAVNLLLDHEQDREYARSMRTLAKECELPEYIIQIRHECSHREIPELNTLRLTALDVVNYIYTRYWSAQYKTILYKFDNRDYDILALHSLLFWSYATVVTVLPPDSIDPRRVWTGYPGTTSLPLLCTHWSNSNLRSALTTDRRLLLLRRRLLGLSCRCKTNILAKQEMYLQYGNATILQLISRLSSLSRRLSEGCAHMDFFVSVFVEFIFAHFDPSPDTLFIILLLDIMNQLPFDFVVQLAATMLCIIFNLPDILSDDNAVRQPPMYRDRIGRYETFLSSPSADLIRFRISFRGATQRTPSFHSTSPRHRINSWLISILEYAMLVDRKEHCHQVPSVLRVLLSAGTNEAYRLWIASGNALGRFCHAVYVLLPHVSTALSTTVQSNQWEPQFKPQLWESDPLSHVLGLYKWLSLYYDSGNVSKYVFTTMSADSRDDGISDLKKLCQAKQSQVDILLSPGTYWDPSRWKLGYTVRRLEASRRCHSRIVSTLGMLSTQCPIQLSGGNNRRVQRATKYKIISDSKNRAVRSFLRLYAQFACALAPLSHRERYS